MAGRTRRAAESLLCTSLWLACAGCNACSADAAPPPADAARPTSVSCTLRTTERLGIPFVKVCPQDLEVVGAAFEPFWIAAAPLGCSAGEHATLRCPSVVALAHPAAGEARAPRALPARLAAVVEHDVAQSVCFMRFGGRLPTREERGRAHATMGLASVVVAQQPTHFDYTTLSEWVTEAPCDHPSSDGCGAAVYPSGPRQAIPWGAIAACDAEPLARDASAIVLAVDESCPSFGFEWSDAGSALPCAMGSPAARPSVLGFSLRCRPPAHDAHPDDDPSTAAFRCVVPDVAMITGPER